MKSGLARLLAAFPIALLVGCTAPPADSQPESHEPASPAPLHQASDPTGLGSGFLVWESNRSGRWRLWIRDLTDGEARQLSPDEGRNLHCCPHISPDGERIVFLSLGPKQGGYPKRGAVGSMMSIRPDGSDLESLLPAARNYYENRAVVWRSPSELIYIRTDGRTALLDLESGESSLLTAKSDANGPWLINSALTWAASGTGAFAPFLKNRQAVANRPPQPGCQPYFSYDGHWGFWVVAPGGPIGRLQLASEAYSTWLKKSDPRLPEDLGYLYFPMLSADGRLLAFAASNDDHAHFKADYEVFVVETDPRTLEILGTPRRFTHHPATDRFPDVHLSPLALGRHYGEAPFRLIADPDSSDIEWHWTFGDGSSSTGPVGEHVYEEPGRFQILATWGEQRLVGQVAITPAAPPEILSSTLQRNSTELVLTFNEAVETSQMTSKLDSGIAIESHALDREDRRLILRLSEPLQDADTLHLSGITDHSSKPNRMPAIEIEVEPPLWPSSREGLEFLWATGDAPNLLFDPVLGAETAVTLTPKGTARLDSAFAMRPAGGFFAGDQASQRVAVGSIRTYEISVEAVLTPDRAPATQGIILTSASRSRSNFSLYQQGQGLYFAMRMRNRGNWMFSKTFLADIPPARRAHVVVTYSPGEMKTYLDGALIDTEESIVGGFFHWRPAPMTFGSDWNGKHPWSGTLEGVAIYSRVLTGAEVQESFSRYSSKLESRQQTPSWTVRATLDRCAEAPTLEKIDPYREALVACVYQVNEVLSGSELGHEIRVARWSIMDGTTLGQDPVGTTREMRLTSLADNPQLASIFLSDTLEPTVEGPLFYLQTP